MVGAPARSIGLRVPPAGVGMQRGGAWLNDLLGTVASPKASFLHLITASYIFPPLATTPIATVDILLVLAKLVMTDGTTAKGVKQFMMGLRSLEGLSST